MKRIAATVAVTGLLVGTAAYASADQLAPKTASRAVSAPAPLSFKPAPIEWGTCKNSALVGNGGQCGHLIVPMNYSKPEGTKIKLAVSRIKHSVSDDKYQGVMLTNPGGPGESGLMYSLFGQLVPNNAGAAYDWIGFDPRGVGSSIPALSCDGDYQAAARPQYVPTSRKIEKAWLERAKGYAKDCDEAGGELLDHLKTVDTVNDMESLRKALGESQINYYGISYGTYLGQVYSTLHPTRIRRMVMDGVVNPKRVWYGANTDQDVAFNKSIKIFFSWVAKHDATYHLGESEAVVERKYYDALRTLAKNPAGGKLGAAEWTDVFTSAGYATFTWEPIADVFAAYVNDGAYAPALEAYEGTNPTGAGSDNSYAIYNATQCTDVAWPRNFATWRADSWSVHASAPFQTWSNTWYNAPCLTWGAKAGKPATVDGSKAPPVLLINETLDAATPYSGALEVRRRFPKSVLIEGVGGTSHASAMNGIACTDDVIATYLTDGSLPSRVSGRTSDVQCDPAPQPDPRATGSVKTLKKSSTDSPTSSSDSLIRQSLRKMDR